MPAILLNLIVGGVRIGIGAGFIKTICATGALKVHAICAGEGLPFIESSDELGERSC